MPLSDHFACLILASSSHVIYYEEGEMIKQYLIEHRDTSTSNAEQMRMMFNKWTSSQNYGDDYDGTIELSIPSSDFRYQMNYYTMNNITVAFIYHHTLRSTRHGTTRYKFMKRMNDNLVYIHQQIMTHLVDIHDIPLYIMRIRCRTIIQPIIQPLKRNECIQSCIDCCHCECDQDCLFCAFWVIFVIITGGLGLFCFLCYRYYWLEQQTGAALDQVQHDLDQALSESEVGFGSGLQGNQVGFNPLATGFNPNVDDYVPNRPPEHGGVGKDFVRPNVETQVFKQQYGPQEGNLGGGVDPNTDPELVMAVRLSLEEPRQSQAQAKKAAESPLGSTSSDEDIDGLIAAVLQDIEIQDTINEGREEGDSKTNELFQRQLEQQNEMVDVQAEIFELREDYGQDIEENVTNARESVKAGTKHLAKAEAHQVSRKKKLIFLFCFPCVCIAYGCYYGWIGIRTLKDSVTQWFKSRSLVDNVFTDLENMFYLLSKTLTVLRLKWNHNQNIVVNMFLNVVKFIGLYLVMYPLIIVLCIITVLPSLFFLLVVRMNKIETDTKQLHIRGMVLDEETFCQRLFRIITQLFRSSFMFSFITVYPIMITYIIIPRYGNDDYVVLTAIGSYLFIILLLQIFGTYRGLKSFNEKSKTNKTGDERFKSQKFEWNLGSLLSVVLLVYEMLQFTMFASHVMGINSPNESSVDAGNSERVSSNNQILQFVIQLSYISFNFVNKNLMEFYSLFNFVAVGLLLSFFVLRFMFELKRYGKLKYIQNDTDSAEEFYFHSFVGTIIYGHGTLKNLSAFSCKIVSLLSDTMFLIICEKLIILISCTSPSDSELHVSYLRVSDDIVCWEGKHQLYATINLILIGYYIPISVMIAPMFAETHQDNKTQTNKSRFKRFISFTNTVSFVKPFLSTITVTKCFMLISATFVFRGGVIGTIVSQSISMLFLLFFTIIWSFSDLKLNGLTQNKPGFPFSVNLIRICGFCCGLFGCIFEILRIYTDIIDSTLDFIILLAVMVLSAVIALIIFCKYHSKYDLEDDTDSNWIIKYESNSGKTNVVSFTKQSGNTNIHNRELNQDMCYKKMDDE